MITEIIKLNIIKNIYKNNGLSVLFKDKVKSTLMPAKTVISE